MSQQENTEKFRARLRFRMARLGLQSYELAEKIGVAPSAISNWLSGANGPKPKTVHKLANALGCEFEWLIGSDEQNESALHETSPKYQTSMDWKQRAEKAEQNLNNLRAGLKSILELSEQEISSGQKLADDILDAVTRGTKSRKES